MLMRKVSLVKMKAGQKGKVLSVRGGTALQNRLMSMGIFPGKEILKLSSFALRGPVTIKVGKRSFALGHGMSSKILVELIE